MKKFLLPLGIAILTLACRLSPTTPLPPLNLYPTPTTEATQTPIIVRVEKTVVVQITNTPKPTHVTVTSTATSTPELCISAIETVYLRPSPSVDNYPITQLENGTKVLDMGGRDGKWVFVEIGGRRGWVNEKYISDCE